MFGSDFVEHRAGGACATVLQILKPLPNALGGACFRCEIEQMLIGFGVLKDRCRLSVHGQYDRAP